MTEYREAHGPAPFRLLRPVVPLDPSNSRTGEHKYSDRHVPGRGGTFSLYQGGLRESMTSNLFGRSFARPSLISQGSSSPLRSGSNHSAGPAMIACDA